MKRILNSDGTQFHQYQQNEQPPLTSKYWNGHLLPRSIETATSYLEVLNTKKTLEIQYSETFLNQTLLGPTFVFGIDRCSVYTV